MRTRLLLILMVVLGAFPAAMAATPAEAQIAQCAGAEPTISLSPISGPSGTQVTLRYRNFDPGDPLKVIFRSAGDPVVATGTADADGEGRLVFTVPSAPDGLYWVYVECHTAAHFRIGPVTPTVTSSPTQTATPTNTPAVTRTPAPPTPVNTVAPPPPTPLAPRVRRRSRRTLGDLAVQPVRACGRSRDGGGGLRLPGPGGEHHGTEARRGLRHGRVVARRSPKAKPPARCARPRDFARAARTADARAALARSGSRSRRGPATGLFGCPGARSPYAFLPPSSSLARYSWCAGTGSPTTYRK